MGLWFVFKYMVLVDYPLVYYTDGLIRNLYRLSLSRLLFVEEPAHTDSRGPQQTLQTAQDFYLIHGQDLTCSYVDHLKEQEIALFCNACVAGHQTVDGLDGPRLVLVVCNARLLQGLLLEDVSQVATFDNVQTGPGELYLDTGGNGLGFLFGYSYGG